MMRATRPAEVVDGASDRHAGYGSKVIIVILYLFPVHTPEITSKIQASLQRTPT